METFLSKAKIRNNASTGIITDFPEKLVCNDLIFHHMIVFLSCFFPFQIEHIRKTF